MTQTNYSNFAPAGYQSIASTSVVAGLTIPATSGSFPTTANYAYIVCEGASARWRDDGTPPTAAATGGTPIAIGGSLNYDGKLTAIQFITAAGSTGTIHVNYYRGN